MNIFRLERFPAFVDWEELSNVTVIAQNEEEARMRAYLHFEAYKYAPELFDSDKCILAEFEGLEQKVAYMRDVKGMTLIERAADLGYSYIWIKKISSRTWKQYAKNILMSRFVCNRMNKMKYCFLNIRCLYSLSYGNLGLKYN
ncbi:hypothetical protein [Shimazuella alba]|uniref:Uncharacterized protein n=1 Tax=Shimazuella alba TaxID=2690964 RepID=A0A6I4VL93_9BACL|nr:hypothetical protein [Shimazuella alba]MXQ52349.1 hypothetical protein [Shimazuella alba]